jgi:hypothetical protein
VNIFVLSLDPEEAAGFLFDKHVRSQALETAQILSTVNGGPYKPTHAMHPCVLWAGAFLQNYQWTVRHGTAICLEYERRFRRRHACTEVMEYVREPLVHVPVGSSPFELCMPPEFKGPDAVESYRRYYAYKASAIPCTYTSREPPYWLAPMIQMGKRVSARIA